MLLMIYCTAALTSFSDSISYITYLFLEWRIAAYSKNPYLGTLSFEGQFAIQAIPGNDQNASPTNQKTAGSKLERTS